MGDVSVFFNHIRFGKRDVAFNDFFNVSVVVIVVAGCTSTVFNGLVMEVGIAF